MPSPWASRAVRYGLSGLVLLALAVAGCASPQGVPQVTVQPKTEAAREIQWLYEIIFWAAVLVFVVTQGVILYTVIRFRYRPGHELPEQVHGNTKLEITWTILPALVLVAVAIPTIRTIFALEGTPPSGAMQIDVVGRQWWWEIRYPGQNVIWANELVLPAGQTVELRLRSEDVVHSFWIPQLMGKQDVMPAHVNTLWFTPEEPGQYFGQCAEYCGIQHAQMRMNAIVLSQSDWQAWVARSQRPALPTTDLAQEGEQVFTRYCVTCHAIDGTAAQARNGPDLSHLGSRTTIASGILPNTTEDLARWLRSPEEVKPGNHMANPPERWGIRSRDHLTLRPRDVDALVEYLHSLK